MFSDLEKTKRTFESKSVEKTVDSIGSRAQFPIIQSKWWAREDGGVEEKSEQEYRSEYWWNNNNSWSHPKSGRQSQLSSKEKQVFSQKVNGVQKWQWFSLRNSSNTRPGWVIQKNLSWSKARQGRAGRVGLYMGFSSVLRQMEEAHGMPVKGNKTTRVSLHKRPVPALRCLWNSFHSTPFLLFFRKATLCSSSLAQYLKVLA